MKISEKLYVTNRGDWRNWLENNHASKKEVWLLYYKKHTGKSSIPYNDAVEEAICFGWIDSIVKKIDEEKYAQKFTPRKDKNCWSELNIKRAIKMIKEGKMTKSGLEKIHDILNNYKEKNKLKSKTKRVIIPPFIKKALSLNNEALKNFNNLAYTYKSQFIGWIMNAKKEETRNRRLKEAIGLLEKNEKLGLK